MAKAIFVDLRRQILYAYDGARLVYRFDCVSGDRDHTTTPGTHTIGRKHRIYRSRRYGAQMNYAMFFHGGEAIHEANAVLPMSHIRTALRAVGMEESDPFGSHGCVRLEQNQARMLFEWTPPGTRVTVDRQNPRLPGPYLDGGIWRDSAGNPTSRPDL
jgi:lipoprotein-anchoring transpeptidase ErfK/SrfK